MEKKDDILDKDFPVNYPEMVVTKATGVTVSEQKLISLGYNTFFSLWSYPNPFRKHKLDKELCDLLVVFGDDIIIFSDKDCTFPEVDDISTAWGRWYRKSIKKSCEQLLGAMTWIKKYPDRIALDPKGEKDFPLNINVTEHTRFHLVAVAHGVKDACIRYFDGGDGGLLVDNFTVFSSSPDNPSEPFHIGKMSNDPNEFIHVFDDASYSLALSELDTVQDFVDYLHDRKRFLLSSKDIQATSEREMLAIYLKSSIHGGKDGLSQLLKKQAESIFIDEGIWDEFVNSTSYTNWKKQVRTSYFWDDLLRKTINYIEKGQSLYTTEPTIESQSQLFYHMAKENRFRRLALSEGFLSFFMKMPDNFRGTRTIVNQESPSIGYVLFLFPKLAFMSDKDYHDVRSQMLIDYCQIAKLEFPDLEHIIGIAHETNDLNDSSEDFCYLDATEWTIEREQEAISIKKEFIQKGMLGEFQKLNFTRHLSTETVKGRDRNKPCPCGSGIKYKRCCGRKGD